MMELLLQLCDTVHTSHLKDTWRKLGMDVLGTTSCMVPTAGMGSSCMFLITALGLMSCVYQWMLPSGPIGEQSMVMFNLPFYACGNYLITTRNILICINTTSSLHHHYIEYFNTVSAPQLATYRLPLIGSRAIPQGSLRLPTVWILFPSGSKMERQLPLCSQTRL